MSKIISIPIPCNEDWDAMSLKEQGRHCDACSKTVIDFTTWQPQEILYYFKKNKNICGRFTASQLNEPIPTQEDFVKELFYLPISTLKRVAAIFLFAFVIGASSCNEHITGVVIATHLEINKTNNIKNVSKRDTTISLIASPKNKIAKQKNKTQIEEVTIKKIIKKKQPLMGLPAVKEMPHLMGEPAMNDNTEAKPTCKPENTIDNEVIMGKMIMPSIDSSNKLLIVKK